MLVYVTDSSIRPVAGADSGFCARGVQNLSARSAEKIFHLRFSVVWIASRSTYVFCTALLTAEYAEGDRVQ